jgi:hypothetical protein
VIREPLHLLGKPRGRIDGPDTFVVEQSGDPTTDRVDLVVGGMELEIGRGSGRTTEVVDVRTADEPDERFDAGKHLIDVLTVLFEIWVIDGYEADVIGAGLETE